MTEKYLGHIELEGGDLLQIKRIATGRDLLKSMKSQADGNYISTLIAQVCYLNDKPITSEIVEEFDSGVSLAVQEVVVENVELIPEQVETYPKSYILGDKIIEVTEPRKIKHDNKASRYGNGDPSATSFWLLSLLIKVDGEAVRYDDFLDFPAGEIQALMPLVTPKKPKFVPVKM